MRFQTGSDHKQPKNNTQLRKPLCICGRSWSYRLQRIPPRNPLEGVYLLCHCFSLVLLLLSVLERKQYSRARGGSMSSTKYFSSRRRGTQEGTIVDNAEKDRTSVLIKQRYVLITKLSYTNETRCVIMYLRTFTRFYCDEATP